MGLTAAAALVIGACGDEDPTGVGGDLLPGGVIRTFELVLEPDRFLITDTILTGFTRPRNAGFLLVAEDYAGALDARPVVRYGALPRTVAYRDTQGVLQEDTLPTYVGGRLILRIDTLHTRGEAPARLRLHRVAEDWDPGSATWTLRVDSGGVRLPWGEAGGSPGALVDTATWVADADSVMFAVDSQTVALWADTANPARGAVILAETPGARLRSTLALLVLEARPSERPDTVVTTSVAPVASTFLFDPSAPRLGPYQVGGNPAWRTVLRFQRLDTLTVPCAGEDPGCRVQLRDAKVNYAAVSLQPLPVPAAFAPEDSLRIDARSLLVSPGVPLERSPLGDRTGPPAPLIPASRFDLDAAPEGAAEVPATNFVAALVAGEAEDGTAPPDHLALIAFPEGGDFGFGAFARAGAAAPRLRIVVTVSTEAGLQ